MADFRLNMQFLYPEFLWGLLAVGVPIIIHLLQLRRPQRVLFTNTGFIRELEMMTMRRRRLQELWVLLMRVLGVVFLVLVFAQPFVPAQRVVRQKNSVAVLVDTSPSMQAAGTQKTLLQEAAEQARLLGQSYGAATHFQLIGQRGGRLTQLVYLNKVRELIVSGRAAGWDAMVGQRGRQEQGPLYVLSDFQRGESSKAALQGLGKDKEVVLVPQVARAVANVYVDSLWLDDAFVRTNTNFGLHIRLRNGGTEAIADCPVKVRLAGRQVAAFRVALGSGQAATTVAQVQLTDNKLARGEVVTEDNAVTFDNTYYFILQPTAAIRVLEIGTEPVAQQAYKAEPLFTYSFAKPQEVNYGELQQANMVLLREVATVSAGLRDALAGVVRRGGSVVVVPPGRGASQEATLQLLRALGAGGAQWQPVVAGPPVLREIAMPSSREPFFGDVFGAQPRQVAMPQVAPVLSLGRGGTDIMRLRDGDSYLTDFASGAGRVYAFAAPFDKAYSDFATHALFVPVLYRLAMLSYHTSQRPAYALTEPALTLEITAETGSEGRSETAFKLVKDSLTFIPGQQLRGNNLRLELPTGMNEPGFYELQRQGKSVATLAFNADQHESELTAYSVAELRQLIGPDHPNVQVLDGTAEPQALTNYRAGQTGQPLWRYCLLAVLACLLGEALLLRFGRPKVAARPVVAA